MHGVWREALRNSQVLVFSCGIALLPSLTTRENLFFLSSFFPPVVVRAQALCICPGLAVLCCHSNARHTALAESFCKKPLFFFQEKRITTVSCVKLQGNINQMFRPTATSVLLNSPHAQNDFDPLV